MSITNPPLSPSELTKILPELIMQFQKVLNEQEQQKQLAEEREQRLMVLDKQIDVQKKRLREAQDNFAAAEAITVMKLTATEEKTERAEDRLDVIKQDYKQFVTDKEQLQQEIGSLKLTKNDLTNEINSNKKYLKGQETLVNDTIASLNVQLQEFEQEGKDLETKRQKVSVDIMQLEQQVTETRIKQDVEQARLNELETTYNETAKDYKAQLQDLDHLIDEAGEKAIHFDQMNQKHIHELEVREKVVTVKENALSVKEKELADKEKSLNVRSQLSGSTI